MMSRPRSSPLRALVILLAGVVLAPWCAAEPACTEGTRTWVWTSPQHARPGVPVRIVAVATEQAVDAVAVTTPAGDRIVLDSDLGGGPPWHRLARLDAPPAGRYRIEALRTGSVAACTLLDVGGAPAARGDGSWDLAAEALYAAWIERLFAAPPAETLSYPSLAPVLADAERNFLYGDLGQDEDRALEATPDCADLSYFLRAYFAWKRGLPLAYRACSRGSRDQPPRCDAPHLERAFLGEPATPARFRAVTRHLMDVVHSGSGRTALDDEQSDFYPLPLARESLWPGTLYADPYGHTLVLVQWVPQTADRPGMLLAVDAQPDNSVARKRFWEGTFLFAPSASAGPGFKAHRPVLRDGAALHLPPHAALDGRDGRPPYSSAQATLDSSAFHARMQQLINPLGLDPESAYESALAALMEQLETRVGSVDNGAAYVRAHPGVTIAMPRGAAIFETTGPWEDYSTPSRDMRLLIALRVVEDLPARVERYPELFTLGNATPAAAAARIAALHRERAAAVHISYRRSDGSPWRLSLAQLYARRTALEVAYNPNDCVERRWGATPETPDHATCARRAPNAQQALMEEYRPWFREARRPPR